MEISITPVSSRDIEDVIKLWNKVIPLDAITIDTLEARVLLDENFDENTFIVAKENGHIAGFVVGTYARRVPLVDHDPQGDRCWITAFGVDPDYQKHGIAVKMFISLLEKFKALGKRECYMATYAPGYFVPGIDVKEYPNTISFLKKLGFEETQRPLSMDASIVLFKAGQEVDEKERRLQKNGVIIRPYTRNDLLSFLKFMETEMPADWQRVARSNMRDLTRGFFQADQVFIAESERSDGKGNEVIGYCQFEGTHFGPFGVAKKYQGRGIGTVLLARTLERMRAKGYHNAYVLWTDDIAAKVYSKFQFKETRRFAVMRKSIA